MCHVAGPKHLLKMQQGGFEIEKKKERKRERGERQKKERKRGRRKE